MRLVAREVVLEVAREVDLAVAREVDLAVAREVDLAVAREVILAVGREVDLAAAREVVLAAALEVALVVAPVATAGLELGVLERARGVVPVLEQAEVQREAAVLEQAAELALGVVAVGQGLAEEGRALPAAPE